MDKIAGITFYNQSRIEYFYIDQENVKIGTNVIVEKENVLSFGTIATNVHPIDNSKLNKKLGKVVRIATKKDYFQNQNNIKIAKDALKKCRQLVKKYNLDMNVIEAVYSFNQKQLLFSFFAEDRIDFRDLAKELAAIYKTRIELRQIGVRDKAKKVGGVGLCGQKLCCARYINDFSSVSISMAKNQNLSLNPTKINGLCGRLLCCLKYENDGYTECRKLLPKIGEVVETADGKGKVLSVDILSKKYKIETSTKGIIEIDANN